MDKSEFEKGKQIAYRFLSYRPRSKKEVEKKLKEKKISGENISNIISLLEKNNYLNDREFTLNWIKYRMENKPGGRRSLEYELREKGIDSEIIKESLDEVYTGEFDEYDVAVRLAEKKISSLKKKQPPQSPLTKGELGGYLKRRLFSYLHRKGFSFSLIEKVMSDLFNAESIESI
ncbi:MAG: RecX family transcriptional regulator [Nitrospinae bacterium]|nr:RecX family transcriptional regulator [Nitrospinota bacterium]